MSAAGPPGNELEMETRALLAHLGTSMIATGQPVHEVEEELAEVGAHFGYPDVQIAAGPTGLTLSLTDGGASTVRSVRQSLRLDQSAGVRLIRHQLLVGEITPTLAREQLSAVAASRTRYPTWAVRLSWPLLAVGIAMILQPGWANLATAAVGGLVVLALVQLAERAPMLQTLLPTVTAFVVSVVVFAAADVGLIDGPLRTVLPPVAVLLPGALVVTGMSELAAGHMQAGSGRLIYGLVQLGLFALGLLAATAVLRVPPTMLTNVRVEQLGWWAAPVGLLLIGFGICLMGGLRLRLQGWVLLVLTAAFGAQLAGQHLGSVGLGGFLGAIAASLGAALVELRRPELPRLVLFLPAFWLLVPGSLGLVGATQIATGQGSATQVTLSVLGVVGAIALGLLVGSSLGQSLRGWLHPPPIPDVAHTPWVR